MEKLRIDSGVKRIEVNDNGEYIAINLSDNSFFERFKNLIKWFEDKNKELNAEEDKADETASAKNEKPNLDEIFDRAKKYKDLCDSTCVQIDKLFGEGCVRKVFPDVESPSLDLLDDFFEAITPLLQKFANERREKIQLRYNRRRKGSRSK